MSAQAIRPSRLWYWVAGAAAVGAVVWLGLGLVLGFLSMDRQVEGFQRVPIPGQAEVSFAEPGGYTLYFEGVGASDEQATIPPFDVSLASVGGGEEVLIRPYGGSVSYSFAGHEGRAVGAFQIEQPGRFLLRADGERRGVQSNVAVGSSVAPTIVGVLVPTVPGALILLFGAAGLTAVVAIRRNQARRPLPGAATQTARWGQGAAPAGWFADPGRRHELRYWDGQRWTEHVSDRGTQVVDRM